MEIDTQHNENIQEFQVDDSIINKVNQLKEIFVVGNDRPEPDHKICNTIIKWIKDNNLIVTDVFDMVMNQCHNPEYYSLLAFLYLNRIGNTGGNKEAFHYYKLAAENGDLLSQQELGTFYSGGRGCKKDQKKALYWYQKAADGGLVVAQYYLGCLYLNIFFDTDKGIEYITKSAEAGFSGAQVKLATLYFNGDKTKMNLRAVLYWYKRAASDGYLHLAKLFAYGTGVNKDMHEALRYFLLHTKSDDSQHVFRRPLQGFLLENVLG
ncbi:3142_t:CDS:1 [Ambispora gerdemannii]|uniref:3142_t:CDS:1 n=1 Tax=Ambispora gerdemannii TaxID=144530 RepID=A0A9N9G3K7_9GLOM|nr:3142_t:CDS:1 [Ambispora gerdemannii]